MVNNKNLRRIAFDACRVRRSGERIKIMSGPVYELTVVQQLVRSDSLTVINASAADDMSNKFDPALNENELCEIVLTLREENHFIDSERCNTTGGWVVDGDGYAIWWNRTRKIESRDFGRKIYIKFGFRDAKTDCLILSIHPSKW